MIAKVSLCVANLINIAVRCWLIVCDLMNIDKMQLHFLLRLHADSADLARFASRNFVFVMILDVEVHAEFLSKSFARAKRTFVSFLAGVDSMMAKKMIKLKKIKFWFEFAYMFNFVMLMNFFVHPGKVQRNGRMSL